MTTPEVPPAPPVLLPVGRGESYQTHAFPNVKLLWKYRYFDAQGHKHGIASLTEAPANVLNEMRAEADAGGGVLHGGCWRVLTESEFGRVDPTVEDWHRV